MTNPPTTTKESLLAAMHEGWHDLNTFLATLSEAQLAQPTDAGGWTVKDHVIHLAVWEGSLNAFLQKQPRHEYMGIDRATWENGEIDPINAVIYARNKDLSWAQVRRVFQQAHQELIERIQALSEADLQHPYNYYQPDSTATDSAATRIGVATYRHYARHIPWMRAIAESDAQTGNARRGLLE